MKEFMKKYGVLTVIACLLIGMIGYFTYDTCKDVVPGKSINGKDVIFSIDGNYTSADDIYDSLYDSYGIGSIYVKFEQAVLSQAVETSADMEEIANANASAIISNYQSNYGTDYKDYIESALKSVGYSSIDDLTTYLIQQLKAEEVVKEYLDNNPDVYAEYEKEYSPREVSHILVKMEDSENPTDEELAKVKAVEDALASGKDFAEVAKEYSDDGSAANGGSLGFMDKNTSFVTEFLDAAIALKENEVSDWVKTQYGYHIIKCDATGYDKLSAADDFIANILNSNISFKTKAIWAKAEELGLDFKGNSELESALKEYMMLEGNE